MEVFRGSFLHPGFDDWSKIWDYFHIPIALNSKKVFSGSTPTWYSEQSVILRIYPVLFTVVNLRFHAYVTTIEATPVSMPTNYPLADTLYLSLAGNSHFLLFIFLKLIFRTCQKQFANLYRCTLKPFFFPASLLPSVFLREDKFKAKNANLSQREIIILTLFCAALLSHSIPNNPLRV